MGHKAYDVTLNTGRSVSGTLKRMNAFKRFISRLDGDIDDTYVHKQGNNYIVILLRVILGDEHVETVRAHPSVSEVSEPPKVAW